MNERELAAVLAALRFWQAMRGGPSTRDYSDIETDLGKHRSLSDAEIDALCERLNRDEPVTIYLVVADRPDDTIAGRFYEAYQERNDAEAVLAKIRSEQPGWDADLIDLDLLG
ncbi:MAG: hypothetical protein KIS92_03190 [Planctomycetota bacterium]|nr:hypothetical protein [Planctomycetota bacterium]